jgi:hypothetical protein
VIDQIQGLIGSLRTDRQQYLNVEQKPKEKRLVSYKCQCWVCKVEEVSELMENWPVPEIQDEPVAFLLDLSNDPIEYKDHMGNPLSMAAIIKNAV